MTTRGIALALLLVAGSAFAQTGDVAPPDEFGRVSGGELQLVTKHGAPLSGSISMSASKSASDPFAQFGSSRGYGANIGGTLVQDHLWFFAAADRSTPLSSQIGAVLPQTAIIGPSRALDAKAMAQIGSRSALSGTFSASRNQSVGAFSTFNGTLPSSFLSLHYNGIVSPSSFFSMSVTQSKAAQAPLELFLPGTR